MFVGCRTILAVYILAAAAPLFGQGENVGGQWTKRDGLDPADDRHVVFFTLPADEAELGRKPALVLECTDGKLVHARYFADTELLAKDGDYKNYNAPAIFPKVRVDKKGYRGLWDLAPGHRSAELDDKTLHAIFTGTNMVVRYTDKAYNDFIDTYTLPGLDRHEVVKACGEHKWMGVTAK